MSLHFLKEESSTKSPEGWYQHALVLPLFHARTVCRRGSGMPIKRTRAVLHAGTRHAHGRICLWRPRRWRERRPLASGNARRMQPGAPTRLRNTPEQYLVFTHARCVMVWESQECLPMKRSMGDTVAGKGRAARMLPCYPERRVTVIGRYNTCIQVPSLPHAIFRQFYELMIPWYPFHSSRARSGDSNGHALVLPSCHAPTVRDYGHGHSYTRPRIGASRRFLPVKS